MNFDLANLRAFVAVAELKSFSAAAHAINLSQPALSRRIEKLESALGVRLFERTTRSVNLTVVGRDLAREARIIIDDLDHVLLSINEVAASQRSKVVVACIPSVVYYFLPKVLFEYHQYYPRVRICILDDGANGVLESVAKGEADFGINITGIQEPNIIFRTILEEPFVVVCHRDHPLAQQCSITWQEMSQYDCMTVDRSSGNRRLIDLALANTSIRPHWCFETKHVSTLLGLVEFNLGIAVIPKLAMSLETHSTLKTLTLTAPSTSRMVGLISRQNYQLHPEAQALYALVEQMASDLV